MFATSPQPDASVVDARLVGSKTTVLAAVYKDEAALDTAITASVGSGNLSSLSMNDKVFAARSLAADKAGWQPGGTVTGIN